MNRLALTQVRALRSLNMRRRGVLLQHIGDVFGVSRERARQLIERGRELEHQMESGDPWYELSPRCRNALTGWDCEPTADGVLERFQTVDDLLRVANFGRMCLAELQAWLMRHGKAPLP